MIRGLLVCAILGAAVTASAQPRQMAPSAFDATGWTLLGSQTVSGKTDRDVINVGRYEGKFDQLTVVVTDSDIEMKDMTITFGNGDKWSPKLKHVFKEGARSRAIDLPGNERSIQKIELLYANLPGGGRARVSVYGRDTRAGKPPTGGVFDNRGWTLLGSQTVDRRRDRDTIMVGKYEGRFDQLTMVVFDSDIELRDFIVYFANGEKWSPNLKTSFREGQRTRAIDLPGDNRTIQKIELAYANTPGGGKARVEIWGRDKKKNNPPPMPPAPAFDPKGWTLLGMGVVNGSRDRDVIKVGAYKGGFDQLTMVVSDSDLDLNDFTIVFSNGERWTPHLKHTFREGQRTRVIDLPGKDRQIRRVELAYANIPGGGKARVEVYGRDVGRPAPPPLTPITWEKRGWTFLGKRTVDGWRDRDKLNVGIGKPFSELMFVVTGSDVQINKITVTFGNGETFEMANPVIFKEGTRTAPIDVPGKLRKIRTVEFAYANLPGGGRASVEVWGRVKPGATPTPPLPPNGNPGPLPPQPPPPPPTGPDVRDHRTH